MDEVQEAAIGSTLAVGVPEPLSDLQSDVDPHRYGDGAMGAKVVDHPSKVMPVDKLHGEIVDPVDLTKIEHLHDIGMMQVRHDTRLIDEHLNPGGIVREGAVDSFDRQGPFEILDDRARKKDVGHTAAAETIDKLIGTETHVTSTSPTMATGLHQRRVTSVEG